MFTRTLTSGRKIVLTCLVTGVIVAIFISSLQFFMAWHTREVKYNTLITDIQHYLNRYFADLKSTADILQPMTLSTCEHVGADLTSRAAFSLNVRAFLLVKDKKAFCSSATGAMDSPLTTLVPNLDLRKEIDMAILPGTPMMPDKPAMVIWYRNPLLLNSGVFTSLNLNLNPYLLYTARQDEFDGIAIIVGKMALSTFSSHLLTVDELAGSPIREVKIDGVPMTIRLYATNWTLQELWYALLLGGMGGTLAGLLCYYILSFRLRAGKEILIGIKREQFYVVYQPVVNTESLEVTGLEVLLRWKHPTAGEIPPDAFIHYAEAQQMIVPLTQHLFTLIARDAPALQSVLPVGAKFGINIAPDHLHSSSFKDDVRQLLAAMPPNHFQIVLEITERDMLRQHEAPQLFEWLHDAGCEIAIDDFGTGHSALIYLERYTLDYLKIDRGFIHAIGTETVTSPVLDAVLTLAKRLNMLTVAEGVETPEQAKWLHERGVRYLQGYWISRPLSVEDFVRWVAEPRALKW